MFSIRYCGNDYGFQKKADKIMIPVGVDSGTILAITWCGDDVQSFEKGSECLGVAVEHVARTMGLELAKPLETREIEP